MLKIIFSIFFVVLFIPLTIAETTFFDNPDEFFIMGEIPKEEVKIGGKGVETIKKTVASSSLICSEISYYLSNTNLTIENLKEMDVDNIYKEINLKSIVYIDTIKDYTKNYEERCLEKKEYWWIWIIILLICLFIWWFFRE